MKSTEIWFGFTIVALGFQVPRGYKDLKFIIAGVEEEY